MYDNNETYLMHHGVPGQKWGTRRWQNPDGTLTPEGRAHYGVGDGNAYSGRGISKMGSIAKAKAGHTAKNIGGRVTTYGGNLGRTVSAYGNVAKNGIVGTTTSTGKNLAAMGRSSGRNIAALGRSAGRMVLDGPIRSRKETRQDLRETLKKNREDLRNTRKETRQDLLNRSKDSWKGIGDMLKTNTANTYAETAGRRKANKEFTQNMVSKYGKDDLRRYKRAATAGKAIVGTAIVGLAAFTIAGKASGLFDRKAEDRAAIKEERSLEAQQNAWLEKRAQERQEERNFQDFNAEIERRRRS